MAKISEKRSALASVGSALGAVGKGVAGVARGLAEGYAENTQFGRVFIDPFIETQNERRQRSRDESAAASEQRETERYNASLIERATGETQRRRAAEIKLWAEKQGAPIDDQTIQAMNDAMPNATQVEAAAMLYLNGHRDAAVQLGKRAGLDFRQDDKGNELVVMPDGQELPITPELFEKVRDAIYVEERQPALAKYFMQRIKNTPGNEFSARWIQNGTAQGLFSEPEGVKAYQQVMREHARNPAAIATHSLRNDLALLPLMTTDSAAAEVVQRATDAFAQSGLAEKFAVNMGQSPTGATFQLKVDIPGVGKTGDILPLAKFKAYVESIDPVAKSFNQFSKTREEIMLAEQSAKLAAAERAEAGAARAAEASQRAAQTAERGAATAERAEAREEHKKVLAAFENSGYLGRPMPALPKEASPADRVDAEAAYKKGRADAARDKKAAAGGKSGSSSLSSEDDVRRTLMSGKR